MFRADYFDERAIALFFNELKSTPERKLFDESVRLPGAAAGTSFEPLSPTEANGAFVLIMSTNADAIASTIGSFAESQVVADALTRIVNRDRVLAKAQSDAQLDVRKAEAGAAPPFPASCAEDGGAAARARIKAAEGIKEFFTMRCF